MTIPGSTPVESPDSAQGSPGSRNKRKFPAETPPCGLDTLDSLLQPDRPGSSDDSDVECHAPDCYMCTVGASKEVCSEQSSNAEWIDLTETQLEELLLSNLDMIFKSAIKMIISYGYAEEVAMNSLFRPGICSGRKDTISNVLENALAFVRSGQDADSSLRENFSEDLRKLEKHVLADLVRVIRKVRPSFSIGDAMWCLLICDMNLARACTVDNESMNDTRTGDTSSTLNPPQMEPQSGSTVHSSSITLEDNAPGPNKPNTLLPHPQNTPQTGIHTATAIPNLPLGMFSASSNGNGKNLKPKLGKENPIPSPSYAMKLSSSIISQSCLLEKKQPGGTEGNVDVSKKESISRQRAVPHEKSHRTFRSKAVSRTAKISSSDCLVLDKNCMSGTASTVMSAKGASLMPNKELVAHAPQAIRPVDPRISNVQSVSSSDSKEMAGNPSELPIANTELSLELSSTSSSTVSTGASCNTGNSTCINRLGTPSGKMCRHRTSLNKDDIAIHLVPRVYELQTQLKEWNEWAQQRVMQAARRLAMEKVELETLRQEKEEVARLKKEQEIFEVNTKRKLSEMEGALLNASRQVEQASDVSELLHVEKAKLKRGMEAENLEAVKSAANCEEALTRESVTAKKLQLMDREKVLFQEDATSEKRKQLQLQRQLTQVNEIQDQLQTRLKLEETVKGEALTQADSMKKEREQIEISGNANVNAITMKAQTDSQKRKDDVQRIEEQISQLRVMADSSKIAALRSGVDGKYDSQLSDGIKDATHDFLANYMNTLDLGVEDVEREWECAMCLTEEVSVVFVPCAHQVVCSKCNELHEKQGMKNCPSCRTPIERRICITSFDS